ncbi:hypothetical protein ABZU75_33015 [Streptosporangium sp. NPDC005286]|uniref:hypothetical protein n=1 Tax=Streptosporangium sp. NPDC005286 TaxID=3154463 RepID=UPI0033AE549A
MVRWTRTAPALLPYRAYVELDGLAPGEPIDLVTAMLEMIDYDGGRPLTCLA